MPKRLEEFNMYVVLANRVRTKSSCSFDQVIRGSCFMCLCKCARGFTITFDTVCETTTVMFGTKRIIRNLPIFPDCIAEYPEYPPRLREHCKLNGDQPKIDVVTSKSFYRLLYPSACITATL